MIEPGSPSRAAAPHRLRWAVFAACAPLFILSQFYRVLNAVMAPHLQRDLDLGSEGLGALSATFFYAFAATQIPLALVLDRLGARRVMAALSLVGAAGAAVFATARTPAAALAGEALLGLGMAGNLMGSMTLIGHWFAPREFATVVGAFVGLGTLGNILASTPLALLVAGLGWRRALAAVAVATVALAVAFFAAVREHPPRAGAAPGGGGDDGGAPVGEMLRRLLASRDYWLISVGAFCRYGAYVSIQALWAGPYLVEIARLSPIRAANLILLLNVAFVVGSPLGGWLSDRGLGSRKQPVMLALAGIAGALLALVLLGDAPRVLPVAAALVLLGVTSGFGQGVYPHIRDLLPGRMAGMAMTGVNFFNMLGAAAFLHFSGWLLELRAGPGGVRGADGYRVTFLAVAGAVALAMVLYAFTRDSREGRPVAAALPERRGNA